MQRYGLSGIRAKLVLAYVATLIAAILLVGLYLTQRLEQMVFNENRINSQASLAQLKTNYAQLLSTYENKMESVYNDTGFLDFLGTRFETDYDVILALRNQIIPSVRLAGLHSGRQSTVFRAYTENPTIHFAEITNYSLQNLYAEPWYDPNAGRVITWVSTSEVQGRVPNHYIGCYRALSDGVTIATFFLETELYAQIKTWQDYDRLAYLIDENGKILSSSSRDLVFTQAKDFLLDDGRAINEAVGDELVVLDGVSYYLSNTRLQVGYGSGDWSIISLSSISKQAGQITEIWSSSLLLCLCCLMVSVCAVTFFATGMTNRIKKFLVSMQQVLDSNFTQDVEITGNDEISAIERGFNRLTHNTHRLIHDVYLANLTASRLREEKTDAELIALRRQINPHYLFNTLETIRMNMILAGDRDNARVLSLFAESFRDCISGGEGVHTLRDELAFIDKYFEIQRYCFRGGIDLRIDADASLYDAPIPQLMLQPLVENAVYHGIEMKGAPGSVYVSARRALDCVVLTVQDDGVGMSEETLALVQKQLSDTQPPQEGNRIALRNVNSRLHLLYGARALLTIQSAQGVGTCVTVRLPVKNDEEG